MKVGDRVFVIRRKEFGRIDKINPELGRFDDMIYFVSFDNGIGFWFRRNELTEGL